MQNINSLQNNHKVKRLGLGNKEKNDEINFETRNKPKVNFIIGVFFDGTGNNRNNSDEIYYKKINKDKVVFTKIPKDKKLKNGITIPDDDSYWNPYSNVVLLHDLYKKNSYDETTRTFTLKYYIQGIGTLSGDDDDIKGSAFGEGPRGIIGKVNNACVQIAKGLKTALGKSNQIGTLTFDVFGFSRGAAAARHFCNEILGEKNIKSAIEKGKIYRDNNHKIIAQGKDKIIGIDYFLGLLGENLKAEKAQSKIRQLHSEKNKVNIRFLGLFDTVVGQFIVKDHFGKKIDSALVILPSTRILTGIGTYIETKLDVVKQKIDNLPIGKIVHFIAEDEWRDNFALTKAGINKNIFEVKLPGSHSDIGGGYAALKQDMDILDYDFSAYEGYTIQNKVPDRLKTLRNFYIDNKLCKEEEIEIKRINFTKLPSTAGYSFVENYQLISTRKIIPRYSIVNMHVMRELAKLSKVPFEINIDETKHSFEYKTPDALIKYQKELIEKLKLEIQGKKSKPIKNNIEKSKYVHLSSNYNISKLIEENGGAISGIRNLDKLLYVNHPKYKNSDENSYERELYTHPQ